VRVIINTREIAERVPADALGAGNTGTSIKRTVHQSGLQAAGDLRKCVFLLAAEGAGCGSGRTGFERL